VIHNKSSKEENRSWVQNREKASPWKVGFVVATLQRGCTIFHCMCHCVSAKPPKFSTLCMKFSILRNLERGVELSISHIYAWASDLTSLCSPRLFLDSPLAPSVCYFLSSDGFSVLSFVLSSLLSLLSSHFNILTRQHHFNFNITPGYTRPQKPNGTVLFFFLQNMHGMLHSFDYVRSCL
jgi:hypothetical protein